VKRGLRYKKVKETTFFYTINKSNLHCEPFVIQFIYFHLINTINVKKVLVVEDDRDLVGLLNIHLRDLDCQLDIAYDGTEGFKKAISNQYDLIILDIMLPFMNGLDICREVRALKILTPVLMLTAKSEELDKVLGLETGADDYITKPFGIREFLARVKAIFRRKELNKQEMNGFSKQILEFGQLKIEIEKRKVSLENQRIDLSPKEFDLLTLLASHPGKSYSRAKLLELIWGYDFEGFEHTVNSHINRLRAKIEPDMSEPTYIITTWGVGYRFNEDI